MCDLFHFILECLVSNPDSPAAHALVIGPANFADAVAENAGDGGAKKKKGLCTIQPIRDTPSQRTGLTKKNYKYPQDIIRPLCKINSTSPASDLTTYLVARRLTRGFGGGINMASKEANGAADCPNSPPRKTR